ncbi:MAG TPA: 50S ribosomal protein L21 [Candidatus Paceibacterota bacterium]|nr:50S ribosomal protein L21 [Candidatus Paceibacterota bacterium]
MEKTTKKTTATDKLAVIRTGGKQYVVKEGDILKIEKLDAKNVSKDKKIIFSDVLMVSDSEKTEIGTPNVKSEVTAELIEEGRNKKVVVIHYRAKSRHFKKAGHRQPFMKIKVTKIA